MESTTVTFKFKGVRPEYVARQLHRWISLGGLEDQIVDHLSEVTRLSVKPCGCDAKELILDYDIQEKDEDK